MDDIAKPERMLCFFFTGVLVQFCVWTGILTGGLVVYCHFRPFDIWAIIWVVAISLASVATCCATAVCCFTAGLTCCLACDEECGEGKKNFYG